MNLSKDKPLGQHIEILDSGSVRLIKEDDAVDKGNNVETVRQRPGTILRVVSEQTDQERESKMQGKGEPSPYCIEFVYFKQGQIGLERSAS